LSTSDASNCLTNNSSSILVDSNDSIVLVQGNLVSCDGELDWVGSLEDGIEFLKLSLSVKISKEDE
jgi:hypothetical protein